MVIVMVYGDDDVYRRRQLYACTGALRPPAELERRVLVVPALGALPAVSGALLRESVKSSKLIVVARAHRHNA